MKKKSFQLKIEEPCHENWNAMTNSEQGRFCQSCEKEVIDFTHLSDRAIAQTFKKAKGNVCGRFHDFQLNRPIAHEPTIYQNTKLKAIGLMFSGLLMSSQLAGQTTSNSQIQTEQTDNLSSKAQSTDVVPNILKISGQTRPKVLLAGVSKKSFISINDNGVVLIHLSDETGKFEFTIDKNEIKDISKGIKVQFENNLIWEKSIILSQKELINYSAIDLGIIILDQEIENIDITTRGQIITGDVVSINVEDLELPVMPTTTILQHSKVDSTQSKEQENRVYGNTTVMDYLDEDDLNTTVSHSSIITTKIIKKAYPNPFTNELIVELENEVAGNYHLVLVNELGQEVYRKSIEAIEGSQQVKLELKNFTAGVYFLSLLDKEEVLQTEMVIKE